jgi:hypothetical protein
MYSRYRVFPGGKATGAWGWPPTTLLGPRLCNILSESQMVWYLLRNMENIASSVGSIAQYRFSFCRKVVQWTFSRVNNYGHETKIRREEIYFKAYRSISFFTGFVECQEQGLQQQNRQMNNTNICFANTERDFRMLIKFSWLKNFNLCVLTSEKK